MRCLARIPHRYKTYLFVGLFVSFFMSFFCLSSHSSALEVSCSYTPSNSSSFRIGGSSSVVPCDTSSFSSSSTYYIKLDITYSDDFSATYSNSWGFNFILEPNIFASNGIPVYPVYLNADSYYTYRYSYASGVPAPSSYYLTKYGPLSSFYLRTYSSSWVSGSFDLTLTFSDSPFGCEECEECEGSGGESGGESGDSSGDYSQKLDDIVKAIYTCGAVLIMLYFFFCLYQIVIKNGGNRR